MKLLGIIVLTIIIGVISDCARAATMSTSTHLTHFEIHQSSLHGRYSARGELGYVAFSQETVAAAHVKLKISEGAREKTYNCASFTYDFKTQFLMCDNRENKKPSLTVDSNFVVKEYQASAK
jgi:hypothetical protein